VSIAELNGHDGDRHYKRLRMIEELTQEQLSSVKKSYFNILALFLEEDKIESRYLRCLLKWGFQLHLTPNDLSHANIEVENLSFTQLDEKLEKLESIYHLVYVIYLDKVVEDVELEVASIYASKLGFKEGTVSELFKSIATAPYDEDEPRNVRQEIMDFLKVYNP
jgi:hypothetical protein